ncbi:MAG: hypothetical protein CVU06_00565 [Bacteroidetes bacterium HGW-Bacteroidetes-22]|nr:MAG: hypothetical protein CVU06_00565 [Bacteroidetes bacterium HGW-Bacteroidetes-22]
MFGSITAKSGIAMFGQTLQSEMLADFLRSDKDKSLSSWIIPDTKGTLKGLLHHYCRLDYSGNIIILVSESTPSDYIKYLDERQYDYIIAKESL